MISVDVNVLDCVEFPRPDDQHKHSVSMSVDLETPHMVWLSCERDGKEVFEARIDLDALETVVVVARAAAERLAKQW